MIFYFSGTGNSLYAARLIAEHNNDRIISISEEMLQEKDRYEYKLEEEESIGFVFPIYAWGPPRMVIDFISRLSVPDADDHYVYSLATCGENIGNTMKVLGKALHSRGMKLHSAFSVVMPNNYNLLGDVDSREVAERKLDLAEEQIRDISKVIEAKQTGVFRIRKGPVPFILTGVINPLFNQHALDASRFYATDACTACGLCQDICPTRNIHVEGKPAWGSNCTQCLACINHCPVRAIEYGKYTLKKGRYVNPRVSG